MTNIISSLPLHWQKTSLINIANINMGQSPPSETYNNKKLGLPFFQGKADFGNIYPTAKTYCSAPLKTVEKGDILISVRAPIGPTNIATEESCIGRGLAGIHCYGNIPNKFILYFLRAKEIEIAEKGTGTTFKSISKQILEDIKVPLPPLNEQYRIVEKIEELFSEIEHLETNLNDIKKRIDFYWQTILHSSFCGNLSKEFQTGYLNEKRSSKTEDIDQLYEIPAGWEWTELGLHADFIGAGSTPKGGRSIYVNNGIPFIRSQNVLHYSLNLDDVVYITNDINEKMSRTQTQAHDVLLNITGASIGRSTYIPDSLNQANVNQHVCIIRTSHSLLYKYLCLYLNTPTIQRLIQEWSSGATREALTLSQIRSIPLPMCPLEEQEFIVSELETQHTLLKNTRETLENKIRQIQVLKKSVLNKAFNGLLVSQNSSDEPASELLKRINEERIKYKQHISKDKKVKIKIEKMERTKSALDLLQDAQSPVSAKELWQQSKHWNNLDDFYAELKSISDLIEQTKSETEILLSLKK